MGTTTTIAGQLTSGLWAHAAIGLPLVGLLLAVLSRPRDAPSTPARPSTAGTTPTDPPRIAPPNEAPAHTGPGHRCSRPPSGASDPHGPRAQEVDPIADADTGEFATNELRLVLGGLAEDLARAGGRCRPRVVQHGERHTDLYLDTPSQHAPAGWTIAGEGSVWTREPAASDQARASAQDAAPLLVAIGQPDGNGQLYLDLETAGLTALVGDSDQARQLAQDIITQIVSAAAVATVRTIVVGDLIDPLTAPGDNLTVVDAWDDVKADVIAWAEQSHRALSVNAWANPFTGRGADPLHDALAPLLVVASQPPPNDVVHAIAANRPTAVGIVAVGAIPGTDSVIHCERDALHLVDLGLTCTTRSAGDGAPSGSARGDLTEAPPGPAGISASDVVGGNEPTSGAPSSSPIDQGGTRTEPTLVPLRDASEMSEEPAYEILVRLLGDIRVDGGRPLRTKPTAVLAYIALHRSVSVEALEEACWADGHGEALRKRLKDVMSECRAAVGSQHLPASTDGRYTTGPEVVTDTRLFDLRIERATGQPLAQRAHTYRSALDLVTGKVFTYPGRAVSSFGWIDTENLLSQWELKVERAALECIDALSTLGDPNQAADVAIHALRALPLNSVLTEALMRSHAQTGDLGAVETVYRAHADGLARIHDASPEESTRTTYSELLRARRL